MKIIMNHLTKIYAGDIVLDDLNLEITEYTKCAIIGENGSGKTTLLKLLTGMEPYQEGQIIIPKGTKIGYMQQVFDEYEGTAEQYLRKSFPEIAKTEIKMRQLEIEMMNSDMLEKVLSQYEKAQHYFESIDGYGFETNLERFSEGLNVRRLLNQSYQSLSGGEKTRINLLKLLLADIDIYCLDEPTNHLDLAGIEWLEKYLKSLKKTVVIVSHDRQFLANIVDVFHELEDGNIVSYYGSYDSYRTQRIQRYHSLVHDYKIQQKEIQRIKLAIRRFRQWGNESDNEAFFKKAKTLEKRLVRIETLPKPTELDSSFSLDLEVKTRGGNDVLALDELEVGYDKALTYPMNLLVHRKDRIVIQAENGSGKTTLIRTILAEIPAVGGSLHLGENIHIGYLAQVNHFKDESQRILQYIIYECELAEQTARQYLARFGFYSRDTYKRISMLSGGEKLRLKLIELMLSDVNFLILDEPTNHLDFASIEIVETAIKEYTGTVLVISHDRYFIREINASIYELPKKFHI